MTKRLYYTDSLLRGFSATVVACEARDGRAEVVLDQTAFYPTSGGQPFDVGTINGSPVVDVIDREDGEIVHVVEVYPPKPLAERAFGEGGGTVACEIDWPRRLDHMQQHSGQHILSAAFDRLFGVRTVSFHLGAETSTIDLAREVTPAEIADAEREANQVVWEDRVVTVRFAGAEEATAMPLRKESGRSGQLRLVDVDGFDLSACGGTHVPRTGMVGIIAIAGWERFKGGSRLSFVCGRRALTAHARLRDTTLAAARLLSSAPADLPVTIERLQSDLKAAGKSVDLLEEELSRFRGAELRERAEAILGLHVVLTVQPGMDAVALKRLAGEIVRTPGYVAILAGDGQPAAVVVARSNDVVFDAGAWLKRAIGVLGGRGGGRPEQAQGGIPATGEKIVTFARESFGARDLQVPGNVNKPPTVE